MKIVNWQSIYTHQQYYTWQAFQELIDEKIFFVVGALESSTRKRQGWQTTNLAGLNFVVLESKGWWKQGRKIINEHPDAIHIFGGFWADRRFFPLLLYAVWTGRKACIMQEAYATQAVGYLKEEKIWVSAVKVFGRPFLYQMASVLIGLSNKDAAPCLLSISNQCAAQLRQAGFSPSQIFPFGYFVQKIEVNHIREKKKEQLKLVFVGSLLRRKGVDILANAVLKVFRQGYPISLDVYGFGEPGAFFSSSFPEIIAYKGVIPLDESQSVIAQYDALILPSRHDGWGVVVNEALLQGIPVIVSSHVGAKCLVEASGAGAVFENEDVNDLAGIFLRLIQAPGLLTEWQERASLASSLILPEVAAKYVYDVLQFYFYKKRAQPEAIWSQKSSII